MMELVIEYTDEGRIISSSNVQSGFRMMFRPRNGGALKFFDIAEGFEFSTVSPDRHYFDIATQKIAVRPLFSSNGAGSINADGASSIVLPAPPGARVRVDSGEEIIVSDDDDDDDAGVEFSTDRPGIYRFEIEPKFPLLPFTFEVTANEV
jgi:hypothetical protein